MKSLVVPFVLLGLALINGCGGEETPEDDLQTPDPHDAGAAPRAPPAPPSSERAVIPTSFSTPCLTHDDCVDGYCISGPDGKLCTVPCISACPSGWGCKAVLDGIGSDLISVCLPMQVASCAECVHSKSCDGSSVCAALGDGVLGRCVALCDPLMAGCPAHTACETRALLPTGTDVTVCVPVAGEPCCGAATEGVSIACTVTDAAGTCDGTRSCLGWPGWGQCAGTCDHEVDTPCPDGPLAETCDGLDNDCDGVVDDGATWAGLGAACLAGVGACQRSGVAICDAANPAGPPVCNVAPGPPMPEVCDTVDNDCDGQTDEDATIVTPGELITAESPAPNMLIVLDRSGSMKDPPGSSGPSKLQVAEDAIDVLVTALASRVRFGLMLYPATNKKGNEGFKCGPGKVWIDLALDNGAAITGFWTGVGTTQLGTPTAEALDVVLGYDGLKDAERDNFVLLITDGQSTCKDPTPKVAALLAATPPVKTFVVGFGAGVDAGELDGLAQAGGTAKAGDPAYYQASDAAELAGALDAIAGSVLTCKYVLDSEPPAGFKVYFDGAEQPIDPAKTDGWDYDTQKNEVTFYGDACESLHAGTVQEVAIVHSCSQ